MNSDKSARQSVLFIPHGGGPCFFMDWNPPDTWVGCWRRRRGAGAKDLFRTGHADHHFSISLWLRAEANQQEITHDY